MQNLNLLPWVALLTALTMVGAALGSRPRRKHRPLDWLFGATLLSFAALALLDLVAQYGGLGHVSLRVVTQVAYQLMLLGVIVFLLVAANGWRLPQQVLVIAQTAIGLGLATRDPPSSGQLPLWAIINILCAAVLLATLIYALLVRHAGAPVWMVLVAALASLNVMLADFRAAAGGAMGSSWSQVLLSLILLALWLTRTRRVGRGARPKQPVMLSDRQRLAQDLHDGVGSRLTSIISALDAGSPQQRTTAAELQECLVELKLLVDGMDEDASVLSLLASLRYRIEPLLKAARIQMQWVVADEALLDNVRGDAARQLLHLTQEALANVLRHSGADQVAITCCVHKTEQTLMLEISDNGIGLHALAAGEGAAAARPLGKGLPGMRARAHQLGGRLTIETAPHRGTRLRTVVPLACLEPEEA